MWLTSTAACSYLSLSPLLWTGCCAQHTASLWLPCGSLLLWGSSWAQQTASRQLRRCSLSLHQHSASGTARQHRTVQGDRRTLQNNHNPQDGVTTAAHPELSCQALLMLHLKVI